MFRHVGGLEDDSRRRMDELELPFLFKEIECLNKHSISVLITNHRRSRGNFFDCVLTLLSDASSLVDRGAKVRIDSATASLAFRNRRNPSRTLRTSLLKRLSRDALFDS